MILNLILFIIYLMPLSHASEMALDFTRAHLCKKENYRCGQCEDAAEISTSEILSDETHIDDALVSLIKHYESRLKNKFIPIVIMNSPSLMAASPEHPKIILKSPESEVLIAFNTDDRTDGYQNIETLRFNGKKGEFIGENISFVKNKLKIESQPSKCMQCHGPSFKPLWDSYRAWPAVVGGRDDLIEKSAPSTALIIDVIKRIESKRNPRFKNLSLGYSTQAVRKKLDQGYPWFRIPHFPSFEKLKNVSLRTATKAGPSHLLFDQLSALVGCALSAKIDRELPLKKRNLIAQLVRPTESEVRQKLVQNFLAQLSLVEQKRYFEILSQIQIASILDDQAKIKRHHSFLTEEGFSQKASIIESSKLSTPFQKDFFAVPDPGGYRGVPESDLEVAAMIETLIEPHEFSLADFSMSISPSIEKKWLNIRFSDQLVRSLRNGFDSK